MLIPIQCGLYIGELPPANCAITLHSTELNLQQYPEVPVACQFNFQSHPYSVLYVCGLLHYQHKLQEQHLLSRQPSGMNITFSSFKSLIVSYYHTCDLSFTKLLIAPYKLICLNQYLFVLYLTPDLSIFLSPSSYFFKKKTHSLPFFQVLRKNPGPKTLTGFPEIHLF